jgi:UDP-N-acetylmuramate--alanine ligase
LNLGKREISELCARARTRACSFLGDNPERMLVVSVEHQRLFLCVVNGEELAADYRISTAARGVGAADGSLCTPLGTHRIHERIGAGAPPGTVFEDRRPTGRVWRREPETADLILSRILTLDGCEAGINRGPGVDSLSRYIYIHGTNHEDLLGTPASSGCIRMANRDVIDLFDRVREGDPVVIV